MPPFNKKIVQKDKNTMHCNIPTDDQVPSLRQHQTSVDQGTEVTQLDDLTPSEYLPQTTSISAAYAGKTLKYQ